MNNLCPEVLNFNVFGANQDLYVSGVVNTVYPSTENMDNFSSAMPQGYDFCGCLSKEMYQKYGSEGFVENPGNTFFADYR